MFRFIAQRHRPAGHASTGGIDARYVVPEFMSDLKRYLSAGLLTKHCKRSLLKRNVAQKNKHVGEEVYVIANGPSLNKLDLTKIYNKKVIVMNHFEQHPSRHDFRIVAHCIGEPYNSKTWEDPALMIEGVSAESYWFCSDSWPYFEHTTTKEVHFYCPAIGPKFTIIKDGCNLAGSALTYQSTSQMAIIVAMYMGFKVINLLGFDHDWLVSRGVSPHFYEEKENIAQSDLSIFSYREKIRFSLTLFDVYYRIRDIAYTRGVQIVNMTPDSYLDVFDYGVFS